MESDSILNMVDDAFYHLLFIVDVIENDDNITIQSMLKHTERCDQVKVLKLSKGKLDEEIIDL